MKKVELKICTADYETDPFKYGRFPEPFTLGFYDGVEFREWVGSDCTKRFFDYLDAIETPLTIFMHNGGRFDFHFMFAYFGNPIMVINNRIVKWAYGIHEFRDSFAAMPVALGAYNKTPIDYGKMEKEVRHLHAEEIASYLKDDCVYLHQMITAYVAEFGDKVTMASAAMEKFTEHHTVELGDEEFDSTFREYYAGGRCQAFQKGVISGEWKIYDVNSMYPAVMKHAYHPRDCNYDHHSKVPEKENLVSFITFRGRNYGALGYRTEDGGFDFTQERGEFKCTSHEFFAALQTNSIVVDRIIQCMTFEGARFAQFVDHFYNARLAAQVSGELLLVLFYKLVLNSAYGKFGMDPRGYEHYEVTLANEYPDDYVINERGVGNYRLAVSDHGVWIWCRPDPGERYMNVATAASITGASRAVLWRGIKLARNVAYCDTDSIICSEFDGSVDPKKLGSWKLEKTGTKLAVGGKKLYALFDGDESVKQANKGCKISATDILGICQGDTVIWKSDAPSYSLNSEHKFIRRKIRMRH